MAAREPQGQNLARTMPPVYSSNGAVGSPNRFNAQMPSPGLNTPHQTPVPVPQVPNYAQHSHPNARQMSAQHPQQQHAYAQGYASGNMQASGQSASYQSVGGSFSSHAQSPQQHYASRPPPAIMHAQPGQPSNAYNPPRPPEVYTLPEPINDALPRDVREGFERDREGRVLFFTAPPLDRSNKLAPTSAELGHSIKYLAGRKSWLDERNRKRRERDESFAHSTKRSASGKTADLDLYNTAVQAKEGMDHWFGIVDANTTQMIKRFDAGN